MGTLRSTVLVLFGLGFAAGAAPPTPYAVVEVDRFIIQKGVPFPPEYQTALADDIARQISVEFPTVILLRTGEGAAYGEPVLRISGIIVAFTPPSAIKKALIGFGAGSAHVAALVRFADAAGGPPILERDLTGAWAPEDGLARNIVKLCKAQHLVKPD
jgi:Domain of unknown function (DUF4410)